MSHLVTVTGATGNIGSRIAVRLLEGGHRVRAIGRDLKKLALLIENGADACTGDLGDTGFLTEAFRGADAVFAMIPSNPVAEDVRADQRRIAESLIGAIGESRITQVVALSSIGGQISSGTGPIAGLHEFEELLKSVPGLSVVILRPTYFMENFLQSVPIVKSDGIIGDAAHAELSMPMIATKDIALVAARYLSEPGFQGHSVRELLGAREYTFREAASILGAAIGKPDLPYVEIPYDDYHQALTGAGFSPSVADSYAEMAAAMNDGLIRPITVRSEQNTTPTTLEEFARDEFAPVYRSS